jgi:hypothetical protein
VLTLRREVFCRLAFSLMPVRNLRSTGLIFSGTEDLS